MARRAPKREYREVVTGPSKSELQRPPAGWSPLDDYRETPVCAGTSLQAPGDPQSTCHPICNDCIILARTPHRRAALRAALDKRPA
ncbi:hypothetical protein [Kitasatospora sp. NPDC091276]|uniref:hypothetical protein n=1 Tax=Kitasatospora sp. NPDC091276 TaxID=3155300 RepID=UPI003441C4EA